MNPSSILSVRGLGKSFPIYSRGLVKREVARVNAVDNVSFELKRGETLGLVGESGSGKTTAVRCILRALNPTSGEILFRTNETDTVDLAKASGRDLKALRPSMQMIFQDPFSSLNPRMTVSQIVGEPLDIHRMAKGGDREDRVVDILKKVGLKAEHRTRYPHAFSGGQRQRIGIARALVMRPSFVVADEAVSALDVSVQAQVLNLLKDLQEELGLTYLFVAHNLDVVRHFCDRVAVMYAGRFVELAPTDQLFSNPMHPYTRALLSAVPWPDPDRKMMSLLTGDAADPSRLPPGCAFHPRCSECFEPCREKTPSLETYQEGRFCACHLFDAEKSRAGTAYDLHPKNQI